MEENLGSAYDGTLPNKFAKNFNFFSKHTQGIQHGILAKTLDAQKMLKSITNDKIDLVSKILKILAAGDAESMRDRLELYGPIRFLENHFCEKE